MTFNSWIYLHKLQMKYVNEYEDLIRKLYITLIQYAFFLSDSLFMLLYFFSALDRLLLVNAMDMRIQLFGASSLGQRVLLIVCSRVAHSPTANAHVSMYSGLVSS